MKSLLIIPTLLFGLFLFSCSGKHDGKAEETKINAIIERNMNNVSTEDLAGISKALDLYIRAAVEGESKVARPAFAEGATISHVENDSLICLPIRALFDYYDETGKQPASYEIADCNVANDVAMVRIESKFGEAEFSDIFTLAKTADGWKIVSKIFTVK